MTLDYVSKLLKIVLEFSLQDGRKKKGSFNKAMKIILQKLKIKKIDLLFLCVVCLLKNSKGRISVRGGINGSISKKIVGKKDLVMIQYLFQKRAITFGQMPKYKKNESDHRFIAFKK